MSETEFPTMQRAITPEELNASLARHDRPAPPAPPKRQSEADMVRTIGKFVAEECKRATAPLQQRIAQLEQTIQQRRYVGVWAVGKYHEGNLVTHDGSMWHCNQETEQRPGTGPDWTLAIKRGRDGKDAPRQPTQERTYGR
jgi:hypothetical protein